MRDSLHTKDISIEGELAKLDTSSKELVEEILEIMSSESDNSCVASIYNLLEQNKELTLLVIPKLKQIALDTETSDYQFSRAVELISKTDSPKSVKSLNKIIEATLSSNLKEVGDKRLENLLKAINNQSDTSSQRQLFTKNLLLLIKDRSE